MSQNPEEKAANCSCKGLPIFLLLFVGFLIGLITGFATKDTVMRSYFKMMNKVIVDTDRNNDLNVPVVKPMEPSVTEKSPAGEETAAPVDGEKKEEEKKEDEKKDEVKPEPAT